MTFSIYTLLRHPKVLDLSNMSIYSTGMCDDQGGNMTVIHQTCIWASFLPLSLSSKTYCICHALASILEIKFYHETQHRDVRLATF